MPIFFYSLGAVRLIYASVRHQAHLLSRRGAAFVLQREE